MMIECLIRREGPTTMTLGNLKNKYTFTPIPGAKPGEMVTSVCDIVAPEHIAYLLARGQFRQYDSDLSQQELRKDRHKAKKAIYSGFSVEKYQDKGYIVINRKDPNHILYAGQNTPFTDKVKDLMPWPTEFEAFEWLKNEVEMEALDSDFDETADLLVDSDRVKSLEAMVLEQRKLIEELKARFGVDQPKPEEGKKKPGRPPKSEGEEKVDSVLKQITGT